MTEQARGSVDVLVLALWVLAVVAAAGLLASMVPAWTTLVLAPVVGQGPAGTVVDAAGVVPVVGYQALAVVGYLAGWLRMQGLAAFVPWRGA